LVFVLHSNSSATIISGNRNKKLLSMKKVNVEQKKRIFDDFFKIDEVHLQHERFDGSMSPTLRRLNFERGDGVAALVFNVDTDKIILTNQFRYPAYTRGEGWIIEVVAGMLENDMTPEDAIKKEILEEIGYEVESLNFMSSFFVSPGGTSERIHMFYAVVNNSTKVNEGGGLEEENEDIQIVEYDLEQAIHMAQTGAIMDAKTLYGLLWLENIVLKK